MHWSFQLTLFDHFEAQSKCDASNSAATMRRTFNAKSTVRGESTIRDAYGFEVKCRVLSTEEAQTVVQVAQNLAGLYSEHSATWAAEEKHRTDKWLQFLKDICPPDHQKKSALCRFCVEMKVGCRYYLCWILG